LGDRSVLLAGLRNPPREVNVEAKNFQYNKGWNGRDADGPLRLRLI
jgi:hypothetical protein